MQSPTAQPPAVLRLEGVRQTFAKNGREIIALRDTSLIVRAGEWVGLRGPSGSGKSTLLFAAGGLRRPNAGRVWIDGEDVYALAPGARAALRARRVGFVFQSFQLVPYLNLRDNLALAAVTPGARHSSSELEDALSAVGLSARVEHLPGELSAGEQQRAGLARALLGRPVVVLADEPTGNLDDEGAQAVLRLLDDARRAGAAIVMASHSNTALRCADRTLHIDGGVVRGEPVAAS